MTILTESRFFRILFIDTALRLLRIIFLFAVKIALLFSAFNNIGLSFGLLMPTDNSG